MPVKIKPMASIKKKDNMYYVSVSYAFGIKDFLKKNLYQYDAKTKNWCKKYCINYADQCDWFMHDYYILQSAGVVIGEDLKKTVDNLEQVA